MSAVRRRCSTNSSANWASRWAKRPPTASSLDSLRCVGACGLAPVVMVGQKVFGRLTQSSVKGIIDEFVNLEREA